MKLLLNVSFVTVLLCGVFQMCHGTNLNCQFKDKFFNLGFHYTCDVTSLINTNNDIVITGHSGTHNTFKNDNNVDGIWILRTNTKFIPRNLGLLFNLTAFAMQYTELVEIKSQDFIGMENIEELHLHMNKLTSVHIDPLTKLRIIDLSHNQLEEIPNGVFANNLQLERIHLYNNRIKFLGSTLFDELTRLTHVEANGNICNNSVYRGSIQVVQFRKDIKINCRNPNEVPPTTPQKPTVPPTTHCPSEVKMLEIINYLERQNHELNVKNKELTKLCQL